jgi:hypothetical protein
MLDAVPKEYAANGYRGMLQAMISVHKRRIQSGTSTSVMPLAILYLRLGDYDHCFEWLEKAYSERSGALTYLISDPTYEPIQSDPRYRDLVKRVGLPMR